MDTKLLDAERKRADKLEAELVLLRRELAEARLLNQERETSEGSLLRQWHTFDVALSNTPDFTYIFDLEGRFTYINRALLALWQKSLEESVGKNFFDLEYPQPLAERLQRQIQEVIDTKSIVRDETVYTGADGTSGYYEYIFVPVFGDDGNVIAVTGSTRNVTHQKRIEKALRDSEERLQQIFQQAPLPIVVFKGREFVVELANPFYHALLPGRDLVGRRFADVAPDVGENVWTALRGVLDTGQPFVANEWLVPYDQNGDGLIEDVWFNVVYHPLHDLDGSVGGIIAVASDVSAQVRARQTLERTNEALEEFVHVASHDLQEPLRTINVYSQILLRNLERKDESEVRTYAGLIESSVSRMDALLRDLLTYSQTGYADKDLAVNAKADLNLAMAKAVSSVESRIAENDGKVTWDPLPLVWGNEDRLAQVFQNLLSNALKYRKPNVTPCIHVSASRSAGQWEIRVTDNGIGFDQSYAEDVFGLFKRLHSRGVYSGTGLGLSISKRIVERYNGRMWAESQEGIGSTFFLTLSPVSEVDP